MIANKAKFISFYYLKAASMSLPLVAAIPAAAVEDDNNTPLEEIIVTAQKRSENLQQTPMSVNVFSGATLSASGVSSTNQLAEITPNVTMQSERPAQAVPTIRGVGTPINGPGIDQGVAIYLDGVQLDSPATNLFSVLDLAQVEVLKGPQGTLYGRNALGGVINMTSKKPGELLAGSISAGAGNHGAWETGFTVEGALNDAVRGRLGGIYQSRDDFIDNNAAGFNDLGESERTTVRGSVLMTPTDDLEITIAIDYSKSEDSGPAYQPLTVSTAQGVAAALMGLVVPTYTETDGDIYKLQSNLNGFSDTKSYGAAVTASYRLSEAWELISITGYRESEFTGLEDLDGSALDYLHVATDNQSDSLSQELRLHFSGDELTSVIGAFYNDADIDNVFSVEPFYEFAAPLAALGDPNAGAAPSITERGNQTESWALFTQWDWDVSETITLTLGARYGSSKKDSYRTDYSYFDSVAAATAAGRERCFVLGAGVGPEDQPACLIQTGVVAAKGDGDWSKFSPKLGIRYTPSEDLMFYASYSQGYRDGGFSGTAAELSEFDEETLDAFEVGMKSEWLDGRARLNGSVFYYNYNDLQMEISGLNANSQLVTNVFNAGEAQMQGAELETTWLISDAFTLSLNVGWLDTEITKLDDEPGLDFGFIKEGNEFSHSPRLTASLVPTFHFDLDIGTLTWRSEINYKDEYYDDFENGGFAGDDAGTWTGVNLVNGVSFPEAIVNPTDVIDDELADSRTIVNSSLSFLNAEENVELILWTRNLLNEEYETKRRYISGVTVATATYGDPRTFGIKAKYNF